ILAGGASSEREVSLRSGRAVASVLPGARLVELPGDALPEWLDASRHVVLPVTHGGWGEDGRLQSALEGLGVAYAGSDATASALCMDKVRTKAVMRRSDVPAAPEAAFVASAPPSAEALVARLGEDVVIKPSDQGSSVGLLMPRGAEEVARALASLPPGRWMAEPRLSGRELSIGVLDGEPLGLVEIVPHSGVYDFTTKYTKGASEYRYPAEVPAAVGAAAAAAAARLFAACGCRDFARDDLILESDGRFHFLEINTLPGMTETSLLPKSASCRSLDYPELVRRMVAPAVARFTRRVLR
ncbi:MAG: D-alanine--D-alanine ligase, partial [Verrucomicrobiota bacterium]